MVFGVISEYFLQALKTASIKMLASLAFNCLGLTFEAEN